MKLRLILAAMLMAGTASATPYTITNSFTASTSAVAEEVNENFDAAKLSIDDNDGRITVLEGVTPIVAADIDTAAELNALTTDTDMVLDTDIGATVQAFDATIVVDADIGSSVQAFDADLADLADGSLSGSKVGTGISGTNVSTGTVADARIASTITRNSELAAKSAATSTNNAVARFDSTAGDIQNSGVTIDDSNNLTVPGDIISGASGAGCLMMRDSDDAGWSECSTLNGTLACTIDTDGVCDGT